MLAAIESALKEAKSNWDESRKKELETYEARYKELQEAKEKDSEAIKQLENDLDELNIKFQDVGKAPKAPVNFKSAIGEALEEGKSELVGMAKNKKTRNLSLDIKAVGDMTFSNFGTGAYAAATTETRPTLYQSPFSPLWLRNILPNATTDSAAIQYLRANGGEGAVAVWNETPTGSPAEVPDKPQVDFDFELVTDTVDWIAGWTRIPRSMLEDVSWLRGYLSQQLIYGPQGLFVAENGVIMDALDNNSVVYDGSNTALIEQVYDAAFGQLRDFYFSPTHILANHRDVVNEIMLNKASGSGEYDLPVGTVLIVDGQLTVGGVPVIGVPNIPRGEFFVLDNTQTQFVSRMSPELRFFEEDRDNVVKNLITARVEERAAVLIFNENAIIKGAVSS